jgi:hypothetical protein
MAGRGRPKKIREEEKTEKEPVIEPQEKPENQEPKIERPDIEFVTEDLSAGLDEALKSEGGTGKKRGRPKKSGKSSINLTPEDISVFPVIVLDAIFNRIGYAPLTSDEADNLSSAFVNFIKSLPPSLVGFIIKSSGLLGLVIVLYQIVKKRVPEKKKKKTAEDKIVEEFAE